jgi:hypothetical protein
MKIFRILINIACVLIGTYFSYITLTYISEQYSDLGNYDPITNDAILFGGLHAIATWILVLLGSFTACSYGWYRVSKTYRIFLGSILVVLVIGTLKSVEVKVAYIGRVNYINYIYYWVALSAAIGPHLFTGRGYMGLIKKKETEPNQ